MKKQIYCSLDIEGTGLDPNKDSITEFGAVLFEISKDGELNLLEEFSQLVKPEIPIPPFIQQLTGISEHMVASAPSWQEVLPAVKKFIGNHPIVGQNIAFDLSFLSARGLKLEQPSIDTKELAQIFVPEAEYYNLEYLMRFFDLSQEVQHRALDDSISTAKLLHQIVLRARELPDQARADIKEVFEKSQLSFAGFFLNSYGREKKQAQNIAKHPPKRGSGKKVTSEQGELFKKNNSQVNLGLEQEDIGSEIPQILNLSPDALSTAGLKRFLSFLDNSKEHNLVAVPEELTKVAAGTAGKNWVFINSPQEYFCPVRFESLLKLGNFSDALARFVLKIIVKRAIAEDDFLLSEVKLDAQDYIFQSLASADVDFCLSKNSKKHNCTFSQKAELVSKGQNFLTPLKAVSELLHDNLIAKKIRIFIWDIAAFEKVLVSSSTSSVTLKSIHSLLRAFYDPDSKTGLLAQDDQNKKKLEDVFNRLDVDFGLLGVELTRDGYFAPQRIADEYFRETEEFNKLKNIFEHLIDKINNFCETLADETISKNPSVNFLVSQLSFQAKFLSEFFLNPSTKKNILV